MRFYSFIRFHGLLLAHQIRLLNFFFEANDDESQADRCLIIPSKRPTKVFNDSMINIHFI